MVMEFFGFGPEAAEKERAYNAALAELNGILVPQQQPPALVPVGQVVPTFSHLQLVYFAENLKTKIRLMKDVAFVDVGLLTEVLQIVVSKFQPNNRADVNVRDDAPILSEDEVQKLSRVATQLAHATGKPASNIALGLVSVGLVAGSPIFTALAITTVPLYAPIVGVSLFTVAAILGVVGMMYAFMSYLHASQHLEESIRVNLNAINSLADNPAIHDKDKRELFINVNKSSRLGFFHASRNSGDGYERKLAKLEIELLKQQSDQATHGKPLTAEQTKAIKEIIRQAKAIDVGYGLRDKTTARAYLPKLFDKLTLAIRNRDENGLISAADALKLQKYAGEITQATQGTTHATAFAALGLLVLGFAFIASGIGTVIAFAATSAALSVGLGSAGLFAGMFTLPSAMTLALSSGENYEEAQHEAKLAKNLRKIAPSRA